MPHCNRSKGNASQTKQKSKICSLLTSVNGAESERWRRDRRRGLLVMLISPRPVRQTQWRCDGCDGGVIREVEDEERWKRGDHLVDLLESSR